MDTSTISDTVSGAKEALKNTAQKFKSSIEHQLSEMTDDTKKYIKLAAISTGIVVGGFLIYRVFANKKAGQAVPEGPSNNTPVAATKESPVVTMIRSAITTFLLSIARDKIVEFIEKLGENKKKADA